MKHWPSVVSTARAIVGLLLFAAIAVLSLKEVEASHERSIITIPTLGVLQEGDKRIGGPSYVVIQVDHLNQPVGPEVQFNQGSRVWGTLMGSAVGSEWREAARNATLAAARALREDPREWPRPQEGLRFCRALWSPVRSMPRGGYRLWVSFPKKFRGQPTRGSPRF